ncbi:MAG TPA: gamma-glutamyl-gamma-aminobutyrate hydrolase family protein, partial [Lunatimonas sp.]|nr:gamma-glutamyl-gamma-aminobutyrate hydrolase family protein [Lunatimonas sp.]
SRLVFGPKTLSYLENDMATYISQKGVLPVLIPDLVDDLLLDILDEMDGFVFQGGTDLAPFSYGEEPIIPGKWLGDPVRDAYEMKIMDFAFKNEKPIFAICRGFQLLNVYLGGTLYQDIATQRPDAITHRDAQAYDGLRHELKLVPGELLHKIYGDQKAVVNTVHHQGIKTLGNNLTVLASSKADGIIEAVEYSKDPSGKVLGVQWHPEFSFKSTDEVLDSQLLYQAFLTHLTN